MQDFYREHYRAYHERTFAVDPAAFLSPFLRALPAGAAVLDVGCGSGRDLLWLKNKGFSVTGLEKSPELADLARKNAGVPVIEADFETFDFSSLRFDAVLASAAFVHLPHERLEAVVRNVSRALAANGIFYTSLKMGGGASTDATGRVFYLWRDPDLREVFNRLGLSVLTFSRSASALNAEDVWLGYVLQRTC